MTLHEEQAKWLDDRLSSGEPVPDIRGTWSDFSRADAYPLQLALMDRRVSAGDRIAGYKAALTSKAMQEQVGIHESLLGTLLGSRVLPGDSGISVSGRQFMRATLEPEIAVVMGANLRGPDVDAVAARLAVAGYAPALELGDYRAEQAFGQTFEGSVICNTFNGAVLIGQPVCSPDGIDLRTEGMSLYRNGDAIGSGTGVEVLGDPLNSVAFMANKLAGYGRELKAGMVLMTGSIVASIPLEVGDHIEAKFTRLGSVSVQIEP